MDVVGPGNVRGIASENPGGFRGSDWTRSQRLDNGAAAAVHVSVLVERVVDAVVEVARVGLGEEEVDSVTAVGSVLDVRPLLDIGGEVYQQAAGIPVLSEVVRPHPGGLECVIQTPKEIVDSA